MSSVVSRVRRSSRPSQSRVPRGRRRAPSRVSVAVTPSEPTFADIAAQYLERHIERYLVPRAAQLARYAHAYLVSVAIPRAWRRLHAPKRIQQKIVELDFFLFLATANSMASRWCPWEIGYADGKKAIEWILLVRTTDGIKTHGNEYLQLYRNLDFSDRNELAVWQPGRTQGGILVKNL